MILTSNNSQTAPPILQKWHATAGFTLLEVMIAMAVLAFISLGIFQAVTGSFRLREELLADGDFYTGIRLAMGIIQRDVELAYSPTILLTPKPNASPSPTPGGQANSNKANSNGVDSGVAASTSADLAQSFTFWTAATDNSGLRPSHFIGSETKMTFVSAANYRIYRDSPESEFSKVTYEVKLDDSPPINNFKAPNSSVLIKSTSANAFDNDDLRDRNYTHVYPLLHGITQWHFKYYKWKDNKLEPYTSWDSDKEDFKNQFPDIVEATLEVKGPTHLSFEGTYRFKPEIPLRGINPSF